jgi:D-glycero-alpha-D-manno-heptose-7-phosphate kinase
MGGTLDIRTFYWPLSWCKPCTINLALDMRTEVRLLPYKPEQIKVSSRGFDSAEMPLHSVPFSHPLGLIFAVAYYFKAGGLQIEIDSASPPRSALGGSSAAAVALITALSRFFEQERGAAPLTSPQTALIAHAIEESAAGVPCGMQDHLAAVYGGINRWDWQESVQAPPFSRKQLISNEAAPEINRRLLVAYCGIPHTSKDINGIWIKQFLSGKTRAQWIEIARCSNRFAEALERLDIAVAVDAMNREMAIRKEMTPGVLDDLGDGLTSAATAGGCGSRITGAGGGGCIWALGEPDAIERLRPVWETILSKREDARILDCGIDSQGVTTHS